MGVIINTPDPFGDDIFENILDNLIQENIANNEANSHRIKQKKSKSRAPVKPMDATTSRAGKIGNRRNRRYENANFLTTLAGNQDFGEVSIYDFVPETISAFAQVLKDNSNVWNNIINCSEEAEEQYLRQMDCSIQNLGNNETSDERQIHPAFDANLCFERIENRFKSMFKKRQFPLGSLAYLEDQITSFFLECPRSVYTSLLPSAFDRLILHALCQYLDLHSESFTRRGARHTEVKNPRDEFSLPTSSLTSFIENRLNSNSL